MHKFKGADGIRGIACLIVLILHNTGIYINNSGNYTRGVEKYGVWLFFILSAFLLSYKLIHHSKPFTSLVFYFLSRAIRILPAFYVCAIFYWHSEIYNFETLENILFFKSSYAHLWTIPVEFKFYFILPLATALLIFLDNKFGTIKTLYISLLLLFIHQYFYPYANTQENSISLTWYIPVFVFGIIIAIIHANHTMKINNNWRDFIGLIIIIALLSVAPGLITGIYKLDSPVNLMNKFIPLGILLSIFILLFCNGEGIIGAFVSMNFFRWIGKYSFSIYLYHFNFLLLGKSYAGTAIASMGCSLFLSIAMGVIMYYIVEYPCNFLRSKLERAIKVKFPILSL